MAATSEARCRRSCIVALDYFVLEKGDDAAASEASRGTTIVVFVAIVVAIVVAAVVL